MHFFVLSVPARQHLLVRLALVLPLCSACRGVPPEVAIVPGPAVNMAPFTSPDTVIYRRSVTRNGRDSTAGLRTVVRRIRYMTDGGSPILEVEQRFPGGGGVIVDSAFADLSTLRAIAHRSHQPSRTMRFDFVRDTAQGIVIARESAPDTEPTLKEVHQPIGGPLFDSNILELVVASLPLRPRFTTELPFFFYERGGRVPMTVVVRERTRGRFPALGERDVWIVSVGVPGAPATVWVDAATRGILRVRYDLASASVSFTDDRVTPLPS
jgi:hypothetical protein